MRPIHRLLIVVLALTLVAVPAAAKRKLKVGAASRSLLPLVNGSHGYLAEGFPGRDDPLDPGIVVPAWDDGRIAIGNGDPVSYWVHDDLRATAIALQDKKSRKITVIVSTDLYMVFRGDADEIRAKVAARLPKKLAKKTTVLVAATHNHHGPDTAFDVNHDWYEFMTEQVADAVVEAVESRRKARLHVAVGKHWFGMHDGTDPLIFDPTLNVLQATDKKGDVIATVVQWNNHPEGTLGWSPPVETLAEDCALLGLVGGDCEAEGRVMTSDYSGVAREDLRARYGGEALYLNGALGVLIGPGGSHVWEVDDDHPLGNQLVAPVGAEAAGGGVDYTQRNFRRTAVIGEQLGAAAMRLLDGAVDIGRPRVSYAVHEYYTQLANFGFRVLTVPDPATGYTALGHNVATLYTCPIAGPKNDETCVDDAAEVLFDTGVEVDYRAGDHLKTAVEYVRIGPIGMMFLPGEIPGELTIGLPADFRSTPELWYAEPPGTHAFGEDYTIPGYVTEMMDDVYKWTIGLGSDQLGYFVPLSNFRVLCVLDELVGPGACADLYDAGELEFPDSVSAATCKDVALHPAGQSFVNTVSCRYGQALGEAQGHYEETNSAGWDLPQDMIDAVAVLTGNPAGAQVNPDFPGWWQGNLPPGDLP